MNKFRIAMLLTVLSVLSAFSEVYVRYNYYGYSPSRQKKMVIMADADISGASYAMVNNKTKEVALKGTLDRSVFAKGIHLPLEFNYVIDFTNLQAEGEYTFTIDWSSKKDDHKTTADIIIKKNPYHDIVKGPLHWMRVARCGSADAEDHGICHLGDTSCILHHRTGIDNGSWHDDSTGKHIDACGGWHDAADYIKFSLTISYADYMLLRSYEIYPELFDGVKEHSKTKYNDMLDECKWGLDFLMKCMPDSNEFIIEVGNSDDHNVGYRLPENDELDGTRPVLSALSPVQMGYTAAALALGARIFKAQGDTALANKYIAMAKFVYRRATSKDVVANAWLNDEANPFYGDETKNDNLELGAMELYKWEKDLAGFGDSVVNDTSKYTADMKFYKAEAEKYANLAKSAGWRAWESVNLPAHIGLMNDYPIAKNYVYKDLDDFLFNSSQPGNIWGIPMKYVWGGLYSFIGVGAAALEFEIRSGERKYNKLGTEMLDYLLGFNNWGLSFVADKNVKHSIVDPYSEVYNLQADKFPVGAISEGPGDRESWEQFEHYFGFDIQNERTYKFNTTAGVFFDNRKDFMCMETTIAGVADGIFMLTVASKYFQN